MRFNILFTVSLLSVVVSGLVIPPGLSERDAENGIDIRDFFDDAELDARNPSIFSAIGSIAKVASKVVKPLAKVASKVVGKVAGSAGKVAKVAKSAGSAAGKAAKSAGGAVKAAGKTAAKATKSAGKAVGNTAKKAGKAVGNTAKSAGNKAKSAGKSVQKTAKKASNKVKDKTLGPKKYTVPAGGGKPAQSYNKNDIKNAVTNARNEKNAQATMSNRQKKNSPLKDFNNNNHKVPKAGSPGPNSLPKMKGPGKEYPLRNAAQGPATRTDKGPARVIMQEDKNGKLKAKGVVAHDQSRTDSSAPGYNDHFKVKGQRSRKNK